MNEKKEYRKSLENVFDAFESDIYNDKELLKTILLEEGLNPELILKDGIDAVKKMQIKAKIAIRKAQTLNKVELAKKKIRELIPSFTENHKAQLLKIMYGEADAKLAINFSKLDNLNDADIIEMLDEAKLLEFVESLDNLNR